MFRHTPSALLASIVLVSGIVMSGAALAQTPGNPTQQATVTMPGALPVFRVTVVGRTTPAINYRPRTGDTRINFSGTTLMPKAVGEATVKGEKGYFSIEAEFSKLDPPSRFGREYLTYVLWAITPAGRATNLGEIQVKKNDAKMQVTTQLQAFGLIVTAEPYFAVTQPSDVVVMENVVRKGTEGTVEVVDARYELLTRGSYLMNQDASRLKIKPLEPGAPLDLAEARNAVELARVAGADRFAADTFTKATQQLAVAEDARARKQSSNKVMMPARQAAQTAEDARLIGLQRQEEAFKAEEARLSLAQVQSANDRAQTEEARRRQAEAATQTAGIARDAAERDRANADASRIAAERDRANADAARIVAERDRAAAETARLTVERDRATADAALSAADIARRQGADTARLIAERDQATADAARLAAERNQAGVDAARLAADRNQATADAARLAAERNQAADTARLTAERDKAAADAARLTAERDKADAARTAADTARGQAEAGRLAAEDKARGAAAQSEQDKNALREQLRTQLNVILETRETARGLIINLTDVVFDTGSSNLKAGSREKLARLSGILAAHPGLRMDVEGFTDDVGTEDSNQRLSEQRANTVRMYLVGQGIPAAAVGSSGFGESRPVATNGTSAGRQLNRRVELIVSGDLIGRK